MTKQDAFSLVILVKNGFFAWFQLVCDWRTDGQTDRLIDRWTDGRTDKPSYRDARMHLKTGILDTNWRDLINQLNDYNKSKSLREQKSTIFGKRTEGSSNHTKGHLIPSPIDVIKSRPKSQTEGFFFTWNTLRLCKPHYTFSCVLASLWEGVSIRPSVCPSIGQSHTSWNPAKVQFSTKITGSTSENASYAVYTALFKG